jgi:hypothetical protein
MVAAGDQFVSYRYTPDLRPEDGGRQTVSAEDEVPIVRSGTTEAAIDRGGKRISLGSRLALLFLAMVLVSEAVSAGTAWSKPSSAQYLLFQIFIGTPDPASGIYRRGRPTEEILRIVRHIADILRPKSGDPNRILGFSVGPIAMDQGADNARSTIRVAFDVARETGTAVALHLDDYMFWSQARWPNGRLLREQPDTVEWTDWPGTPAGGLDISWLPNVKLAPQMCYESPQVKDFVRYWIKEVIGQEIKKQYDRLVKAGKPELFAGVIAGWESNLSNGYCSLSQLGYSAQKPPIDFDHERERVLQRHIEFWTKGIYDAGIPRNLIFTHLAPLPRRDYEEVTAMLSREQIRQKSQSTAFRAYWTAFNSYSYPGFSAYPDENRFQDIYEALRANHTKTWAMAEGTNVILEPSYLGGAGTSTLSWEAYLAASFNHGAEMVNIFGGFQGPPADAFQRATESEEALAAYRKFLRGESLVEDPRP